jgi:hypothetical protein
MCAYGGQLIVGGAFTQGGNNTNLNHIGRFNGVRWFSLQGGMSGGVGWVVALVVHEGDLYAGGDFLTAGTVAANRIARWDGNSWYSVGSGFNEYVKVLAEYAGNLVAGGWFSEADGSPGNLVALWDGTSWSALGEGLGSDVLEVPGVYALAEFGGDLYAGGDFTEAAGSPVTHLARWDGVAWDDFGTTLTLGGSDGRSVEFLSTEYDGNLLVGGNFTHINGVYVNGLASWDGVSWTPLGVGLDAPALVQDATVYNGSLIVVGYIGGTNILRWDGISWSSLGTGLTHWSPWVSKTTTFAHGDDVYVGGNIEAAGGKPSNYIARWSDPATGVADMKDEGKNWGVRVVRTPAIGQADIEYAITRNADIVLELFDVGGNRVRRLVEGAFGPGIHRTTWSGSHQTGGRVASGVYFVRLSVGREQQATARLVFLE